MSKSKRGESQRVYWQQWLSASNGGHHSRRELITSSAAIRINPDSAKAKDVTELLRNTLNLSSLEPAGKVAGTKRESAEGNENSDSLVLVGTLYSLPKDFVQFEHEPPSFSTLRLPSSTDTTANVSNSMISSSSDPFHVVKTLGPNDNPLSVRDEMLQHLRRIQSQAPATSSMISPKVQWYFVPNSGDPSRSPIPGCIDLDGYCTSMEEEENYGSEDDDSTSSTCEQPERNDSVRRLLADMESILSQRSLPQETEEIQSSPHPTSSPPQKRRELRQARRYSRLCQTRPSCAGYLLKQSTIDPHVWRRVYCVLTDDHLWYTTRVPFPSTDATIAASLPRMGRFHCRISLGRALLLEPNPEILSSPLFRIPHSLELVSSRGTSHIFRAPNRSIQQQWIQSLSTKIMGSFENSLLDHAELIVAEESIARNGRIQSLAVDPVFCHLGTSSNESMYLSLVQASVLRLGMDIAEYREESRQLQAFLNAKQSLVVHASNGSRENGKKGNHTLVDQEDSVALLRCQATWQVASSLLERATQVAMDVQQYCNIGSPHRLNDAKHRLSLSHSLETLCRHVDYVLTGQHRPIGGANPGDLPGGKTTGSMSSGRSHGTHGPPPLDLFDLLLAELQDLVCLPGEGQENAPVIRQGIAK